MGSLMDKSKSFLLSKTIWGVIVATLGAWAQAKGVSIAPETLGELDQLIGAMVSTLGAIIAIIGRVTASTTLAVK